MKIVSVSELKRTLSAHLSRVKAGEEILVTDRGKVIARIMNVDRTGSRKIPSYLLDLEKAGKARIGSGRLPQRFWEWKRPVDPRARARKGLIQEREQGR